MECILNRFTSKHFYIEIISHLFDTNQCMCICTILFIFFFLYSSAVLYLAMGLLSLLCFLHFVYFVLFLFSMNSTIYEILMLVKKLHFCMSFWRRVLLFCLYTSEMHIGLAFVVKIYLKCFLSLRFPSNETNTKHRFEVRVGTPTLNECGEWKTNANWHHFPLFAIYFYFLFSNCSANLLVATVNRKKMHC